MGVENPAYLWGLLAALLPVVLHLIARRKAKVHDFAAIEFIFASNKRIARRLRLKQILLLLMRMLLLAGLAVAFSKPFRLEEDQGLPATGAPTSVVFIVDPSFSMGYTVDGDTLLDRAKQKARAIISDLRPESDAAVVLASSPARALTQTLTYDRVLVRRLIDDVELSHGSADMQGALRLAEQILVASGQPRRAVVLLTDLQASEWEGITRPWSLERSPEVTAVALRPSVTHGNVAITSVEAEPETTGLGRSVRVTVEILNDRPETFKDVVTVKIGDVTRAKEVVTVPPGQTVTREFSLRLTEVGPVTGAVEIPPDDLPGDNRQMFVIDFLRRVHVLVVNGGPRAVPHADETFFLRAALRPGRDATSRINPTYVRPDELAPAQLAYVDVVVLANVKALDRAVLDALDAWVRKGGGLFVTMGDNVTLEEYNGPIRKLLPLPVRELRDASPPVYLTGVQTAHPVLNIFAHLPDASLYTAMATRYALLDTEAAKGTQVLASFTDGSPALVEREHGAGRLLVWTSTIDRDWTDLPFKTSYLPLVQQIALYLGQKLGGAAERTLLVGEPRQIHVGRSVKEVTVTRPDGREIRYGESDLAGGDILFKETELAGIYRVQQARPQGADEQRFAVRVDPRESRLDAADREAIERLLESGRAREGATATAPPKQPAPRGELWPAVLIGLFVLLGMEAWLALASS